MKVIKVNPLSYESIATAQQELKMYKKSLNSFPKLFIEEVMKKADSILSSEAPAAAEGMWSFYTSASSYSTMVDDTDYDYGTVVATGVIVFDGRVEFIEFGTGVKGKHEHGGINDEWLSKLPPPYTEYNMGPSIVHHEDENLDYWVYYDESGRHWTQGVPANPFIYRSFKELRDNLGTIGRMVFKKEQIGNDFYIFK
jgi:hypothetical protein